MIKDFFKLAIINISHRKKRSWLTVIGIFIGIAAVISLISISFGMQDAITRQFQLLGADKIIVMPGGGGLMGGFGTFAAAKLTERDMDLIEDIRGVEEVTTLFYKQAKVTYGGETKYPIVIGIEPDAPWVIGNLEIEGRVFGENNPYKAVVGYFYPEARVFKRAMDVGSRFDIENQSFRVVGIVQQIGTAQDDAQIYIPLDTAREIFNEPDEIGMIYAKTKNGYDPAVVAEAITEELRQDRDLKKGEEDFTVMTTAQVAQTMRNILGIIQSILIGIAAISLLVGGIGIMNTMYTSVMERTREIGIMKAIGAQNHDIWALFLVESGLFGLIGGLFGCLLGFGMAKGVEFYASYAGFAMLKASISWWLVGLGLLLAFAIGAISGLLPARAAAKLKPADALRYE